jgi:hypothetical protein
MGSARAALQVQRRIEVVAAGEERRGVPVVAHAQDHRIERQRQGSNARLRLGQAQFRRGGAGIQRHEARRRRRVLQQRGLHQARIGTRIVRRHPSLIDQGHAHLCPIQGLLRETRKKLRRRRPAGNGQQRLAALPHALAQALRDTRGQPTGLGRPIGEFVHADLAHHAYLISLRVPRRPCRGRDRSTDRG